MHQSGVCLPTLNWDLVYPADFIDCLKIRSLIFGLIRMTSTRYFVSRTIKCWATNCKKNNNKMNKPSHSRCRPEFENKFFRMRFCDKFVMFALVDLLKYRKFQKLQKLQIIFYVTLKMLA